MEVIKADKIKLSAYRIIEIKQIQTINWQNSITK